MSYICVAGMIGAGKSSLTSLLARHYESEAFYESVDDNPILPLFYTATEEEIQNNRYPFLLQLHFLNTRFQAIKQAQNDCLNIMDRSINEDKLFALINHELGRISELELNLYNSLFDSMTEGVKEPHTVIYLRGSFNEIMRRIKMRGREYELDSELVTYYKKIWSRYDDWVLENFKKSDIVVIDIDKFDFVNNEEHKTFILNKIDEIIKNRRKAGIL